MSYKEKMLSMARVSYEMLRVLIANITLTELNFMESSIIDAFFKKKIWWKKQKVKQNSNHKTGLGSSRLKNPNSVRNTTAWVMAANCEI